MPSQSLPPRTLLSESIIAGTDVRRSAVRALRAAGTGVALASAFVAALALGLFAALAIGGVLGF